jgi:hypothetical protein
MTPPPDLIPFEGEWDDYENRIYAEFLSDFVNRQVLFQGLRVKAPYRPATKGKHFSFWHIISESPDPNNKNEEDRVPDLRRCERIRWIRWAIENSECEEFCWWQNQRGRDTRVVIWAKDHDYAVILALRNGYYVLKSAYTRLSRNRVRTFQDERDAYWKGQNG